MFLCVYIMYIQWVQLLYRIFSARLCRKLLSGCNVILIGDLRNFRKYTSAIALINSSCVQFFPLGQEFSCGIVRKHYSQKHLTQIQKGHLSLFDSKLIIYAAICWSMRSTAPIDLLNVFIIFGCSISSPLFCFLQKYFDKMNFQ